VNTLQSELEEQQAGGREGLNCNSAAARAVGNMSHTKAPVGTIEG
jgi:hypothetical protein